MSEKNAQVLLHPPVEWAQRKDLLYVTVRVEDSKGAKIEITDDKLFISGTGGPAKSPFECVVEFYKEIDSSKVKRGSSDRCIEFMIPKKETGSFWPRLLKSTTKQHWLKVDFNKWKDEDDESDVENAWDMNDMMGKMGGMGDSKPDMDDFDDDSDVGELPDLEDDKDEDQEMINGGGGNKKEDEGEIKKEKPTVTEA